MLALGNFGQAWTSEQGRSLRISYAEALVRAHAAGVEPLFDTAYGATFLHFLDADRRTNDIWLLDALSLHNQLAALPPNQSIAIWPLGYEDPALWSLLQPDALGRPDHSQLAGPVDLSTQVLTRISGPALGDIDAAITGQRRVQLDPTGIFLTDTIRWLVQPFKDTHVGAVVGLVEVGNRTNILGDFKHQEYLVTQNVLRRAHEFFDGILVVPGAVGACPLVHELFHHDGNRGSADVDRLLVGTPL